MAPKASRSLRKFLPDPLRSFCLAVLTLICVLVVLPLAAQQFDTGTIAGSVVDSSGAVIPRASITITNVGTGITKTLQTDAGGNFTASALPLGTYVVLANSTSFAEAKSQEIVLNVGAIVHVDLTMNLAAEQQVVEVTGTATTVDTGSSTAGTTLNSTQIANLPINGRDVSDFLEIAPGSVGSAGFFQGSVNGLENIFTGLNVKLDGQNASRGDINGFLDTEGDELSRVTRASIDSIQEIDYSNSGYSAENGFSLGPQMNVITKPGANAFHGEAFEFFRNDALDAKDYFENIPAIPKQPLRMNQFGANLGGPIVPNKLFFFVNYEGDRTHLTNISPLYEIPSALVRSKMNAAMQPVLAQMAALPAGCTSIPAPVSCAVPNTDELDPVTGLPDGNGAQLIYDPAVLPDTLREDTGAVRIDYNISDRDRLFGRYNINDGLTTDTKGLNVGQVSPEYLRTQLGKIDETHTFSSTLLNEFSVGLNRFYSDTNSNTPVPLTGFNGFFTNLGALPGPNTFNQITPFSVFEVFDTVTKTAGAHQLKFGTQIRVNRLNEWLRPQQTYDFASFSDLENDNPFVLQKNGFPGFVGIRNSNWDFYGQDDWRVTRKLTLNLGLRYDFNTVWREGHDRIQNFDIATQSFLPANQPPYSAPKTDFAPRVGFAYDPLGKGKTVIKGYGGIFYMPMQFGFGLTSNIPALASYNVNVFQAIFANPPFSIAYPSPNPPLIAGTQNVSAFPQHPKDPYSVNWLFGIQQEVAPQTVVTVNYVGNSVKRLQSGIDFAALNLNPTEPNPNITTRNYSGFANENLDADELSSNYNALQVQVRHNMGRLNFEANYTWSHEIDDLVNVFGGWSDPYNPNLDRASGDWDVRHNLTGSVVYSLPDLNGSSALVRGVFGGWQASSILQTRSGLPENIQVISGFFGTPLRPDFVSGESPWLPSHSWPNTSYNPAAFELPSNFEGVWGHDIGTVGRNALRAPGFFQWDMSEMKTFPVTERLKVQFRADLFNILNHPNFTNPDGGICQSITYTGPPNPTGTCVPNSNFGRTSQTIADVAGGAIGNGTARQVQFSLKAIF